MLHAWPGHATSADAIDTVAALDAIFTLRLQAVPAAIWRLPSVARHSLTDPKQIISVHAALQVAWEQHVLGTFAILWQWRNSLHDPPTQLSTSQATCLTQSWLSSATQAIRRHYATDSPAAAACAGLTSLIRADHARVPTCPPQRRTRYILFFDGGSRGNPGPGGAGAVIAATDDDATAVTIVWSGARSYAAQHTTNNQAEYNGILMGLHTAHARAWTPLEVVGDSQLIIRQLQGYRPPRNPQLRELYAPTRRLADLLHVTEWHHHLRSFNKAADAAANIAMDHTASLQDFYPTTRPEFAPLEALIQEDLRHWQEKYLQRRLGDQ